LRLKLFFLPYPSLLYKRLLNLSEGVDGEVKKLSLKD